MTTGFDGSRIHGISFVRNELPALKRCDAGRVIVTGLSGFLAMLVTIGAIGVFLETPSDKSRLKPCG
jgi:hypothetical protein